MLPSGLKINKEKRNIWVQISWKAQSEILNNPDSSWTLSFFLRGMCHHLQRDPGREEQRNRVSRDVGQLADAQPTVQLQKLRVPQTLPVLDSKAIRRGPGGTPLPFPQLPTTPGCGNSSCTSRTGSDGASLPTWQFQRDSKSLIFALSLSILNCPTDNK